ncbi:thiomuracin/GE37468 family thiazolyl RiPP peptide [Kitasatospora sp. NPDC049258]|uniref:thiomuracin/GE37468 family thiazolyl RiPP peptide n=1 Tax=Kitasatospora sp. NPDC049258 TaxID=3155394 RepID=UPI003438F57B
MNETLSFDLEDLPIGNVDLGADSAGFGGLEGVTTGHGMIEGSASHSCACSSCTCSCCSCHCSSI